MHHRAARPSDRARYTAQGNARAKNLQCCTLAPARRTRRTGPPTTPHNGPDAGRLMGKSAGVPAPRPRPHRSSSSQREARGPWKATAWPNQRRRKPLELARARKRPRQPTAKASARHGTRVADTRSSTAIPGRIAAMSTWTTQTTLSGVWRAPAGSAAQVATRTRARIVPERTVIA